MSRTLPTEESLGLSPSEEELGTVVSQEDDDVPLNDDAEPALAPAKPGAEKAAQPDPEPEGEKAAEPDKPAETEPPKQVDIRALQEARAEARESKRRADILEQRWNDFLAGQQQPAKPAEPETPAIPGPDDPMARLNWTTEQLAAMQQQQRQTEAQQAEAQRQEQAYRQAEAAVVADYNAVAATDPSLSLAYNALRESQGRELLALGYSVPEAQAELQRIERQNIMYVAQRGLNIADHIKGLATARGWQPAAAQQPAPAKTDVAAVAAAQQRHQSLSDAGGGEAVAPLDAKALAKMTDKQFKAWMSKKGSEAKFEEIMGG